MRINPGLQVLSLVQGTIQIGTGHRARWITGLNVDEQEFVLSLCGTEPPTSAHMPSALSSERQHAILSALGPVLIEEQISGPQPSVPIPPSSASITQATADHEIDTSYAQAKKHGHTGSQISLAPGQGPTNSRALPAVGTALASSSAANSSEPLAQTQLQHRHDTSAASAGSHSSSIDPALRLRNSKRGGRNTTKPLTPSDSRLNPDVLQWSAAYELDAAPVLANRLVARIAIHGLGRTGQLLAGILAASGIGSLLLCDPFLMSAQDVGAGTTGIGSVGQRRVRALAQSLQRNHPRLIVAETSMREPLAPAVDLAVVIAGTMLPRLSDLPEDDRLIPVLFTDAGVRIGPLVIPGLTICAGCAWEQCDPTLRIVPPGEHFGHHDAVKPESSLAATTAGSVATQVLMALDQINIPAAAENMLIIDLATGATSQVPARVRTGCTCLGQQAA